MFGLGMPEILLILAIALIVIGPQKLPELAKTLGRAMGEFKRSAQDFKRSIDVETTVKDFKDIGTIDTDSNQHSQNINPPNEQTDSSHKNDSNTADEKETSDKKEPEEKNGNTPEHDKNG